MTQNSYANPRARRDETYQALLADQARTSDELTELQEFDEYLVTSQTEKHALVLLDRPAPTRGYALVFPIGREDVGARIHLLPGTDVEAARALFSTAIVQARQLLPEAQPLIVVDASVTAAHVVQMVEEQGAPYGLRMSTLDDVPADGDTENLVEDPTEPGLIQVTLDYADMVTEKKTIEVEPGTVLEEPADVLRNLDGAIFDGWFLVTPDGADWERFDWATPVTAPLYLTIVRTLPDEPAEEESPEELPAPEEPPAPEEEAYELPPLEEPAQEESYLCEECGKVFTSKQGLGSHSRTHKE